MGKLSYGTEVAVGGPMGLSICSASEIECLSHPRFRPLLRQARRSRGQSALSPTRRLPGCKTFARSCLNFGSASKFDNRVSPTRVRLQFRHGSYLQRSLRIRSEV